MKPLFALLTLLLTTAVASAEPPSTDLSAKQLIRSEALINELEAFNSFQSKQPTPSVYKARAEKLVSLVNIALLHFHESNTKIDIATAAHFFRLAASAANTTAAVDSESRCLNERPGSYRRLCQANSGSQRDLLLAKAQLHMSWARASLMLECSAHGVSVAHQEMLLELEDQRRDDEALAARALAALKLLQDEVVAYDSLASFEEQRKVAHVSFETFRQDLRRVTEDIARTIAWLPEGRLSLEIRNALLCYQDGAFWWARTYQPRIVNVSELVASGSRVPDSAFLSTVSYTVVINWRQASEHLKRVDALLLEVARLRTSTLRAPHHANY